MRGTSKRTALCGIFAAVSIAVMFFGTLIDVLDLTASAVAALFVFLISCAYGYGAGITLYLVVLLLSLMLFPGKLTPFSFAVLGYYPVLKNFMVVRIRSVFLKWIIKLTVFNIGLSFLVFLGKQLLFPDMVNGKILLKEIVFVYVAANLFIVLFDVVLDRVLQKYGGRLSKLLN